VGKGSADVMEERRMKLKGRKSSQGAPMGIEEAHIQRSSQSMLER